VWVVFNIRNHGQLPRFYYVPVPDSRPFPNITFFNSFLSPQNEKVAGSRSSPIGTCIEMYSRVRSGILVQVDITYALLTSASTHFKIWHLLTNMVTLWGLGLTIVRYYDIPTFVILWVGSGLTTGLLQAWYWAKAERL
jgi:membrane associated rhomboid family serine protease